MHSRSKKRILDQTLEESPVEIVRAVLKAMEQNNDDLIREIIRSAPESKQAEADKYFAQFNKKLNLYNLLLLNKALMAVRFYNSVVFGILGLERVDSGKLEFNDEFEVQDQLRLQISEIDKETVGLEDFEIFQSCRQLEVICDQWIKVLIEVSKQENIISNFS